MKTLPVKNDKGKIQGYIIECPGCSCSHLFYTIYNKKPAWSFNGNLEKPTFRPSMLVHPNRSGEQKRCHSFVTDGKIQFLNDCEHEFKGQTVELPDI